MILSNPRADPGWWARPLVTALVNAGYQALTFVHSADGPAPAAVAALLDHLGGPPVRLLGWSQGAAIAQEAALLRPLRIVGAALIAPYGRQNSIDRVLQSAWQRLDASDASLDPVRLALLLLTSYPPALLSDDAFLDHLLPNLQAWSADTNPAAAAQAREFIETHRDRLAALADIRVPCLVMGFAQDTDTFAARAREVAAAIPHSRYLELPGAGHLTPVTHPDQVIAPVLAFFSELDA
ncbi:alpha/beta fold hydrolase [Winogradskya humida]|uniref:AB hydrolase-1 domain-containing protein n=1 Tax=Winogradskya humida TaxID=113566 RepID=A0ABQ3ZP67_9ACTN|nr:alpha/beta hydrolase [Actinoplanes humidus]GIE20376.1 hypothetical protein Ahu01nite_034780 [Actinoplanes humidus]